MRSTRGWPRFGGAILFILLVAAGCGGGGSAASGSAGTPGAGAPSATVSGGVLSPTAVARLAEVLTPLQKAARFKTTVEVDGKVAVSAVGRSVGDKSRMTVTTGDRTVDYMAAPPKAWARDQGGKWVLVAAADSPTPPLAVLAAPATLELADGEGATFRATYEATTLGLTGDPIAVAITIDGTAITFRYELEVGGHKTSSTTTITPGSTDPIVPPKS